MFVFDDLSLCKLERNYLPLLQALKNESWEKTHSNSIINNENQENWFNSLDCDPISPKNLILIANLADHEYKKIGIFKILNVNYQNRTADVGWDVFKEYRNQGLGKKLVKAGIHFCFQILNLNRLTAEILENNIPSIKCAENANFLLEGCKKEAVFKKNIYINSLIYGILRKDIFII